MKNQLPKIENTSKKGFTLIELMVVVAIIAILSVVAVALFSNAQKQARDGKRKAELEQIANVLEVNKTTAGYQVATAALFGGGVYPGGVTTTPAVDPSGKAYCGLGAAAIPADPGTDISAWSGTVCPGSFTVFNSGAGTPVNTPAANSATYKICAITELAASGNVAGLTTFPAGFTGAFCRSSVQ